MLSINYSVNLQPSLAPPLLLILNLMLSPIPSLVAWINQVIWWWWNEYHINGHQFYVHQLGELFWSSDILVVVVALVMKNWGDFGLSQDKFYGQTFIYLWSLSLLLLIMEIVEMASSLFLMYFQVYQVFWLWMGWWEKKCSFTVISHPIMFFINNYNPQKVLSFYNAEVVLIVIFNDFFSKLYFPSSSIVCFILF